MTGQGLILGGVKVHLCAEAGGPARGARDALDYIAEAWEADAEWIAVPVARLGEEFFHLETRIAGEVIQKLVNYGARLAVVGDIAAHLARSKALRDFVYESNRGRHVWFVEDMAELERMLTLRNRAG